MSQDCCNLQAWQMTQLNERNIQDMDIKERYWMKLKGWGKPALSRSWCLSSHGTHFQEHHSPSVPLRKVFPPSGIVSLEGNALIWVIQSGERKDMWTVKKLGPSWRWCDGRNGASLSFCSVFVLFCSKHKKENCQFNKSFPKALAVAKSPLRNGQVFDLFRWSDV